MRTQHRNTGEYDVLYDIDWFDGHINAAGMFVGVDGTRRAYASFGGYLCAFDAHKKWAASINL